MIIYNGEYISAETGEEKTFTVCTLADVMLKLRAMKDGDALVINASEER